MAAHLLEVNDETRRTRTGCVADGERGVRTRDSSGSGCVESYGQMERSGWPGCTYNPDGTYEAVVTLSSGQRVPSKGTMKAQPDGTVAYEGQATTGIWRLYVLNGQRVIRAEAKNKTTGAATWAELTEVK